MYIFQRKGKEVQSFFPGFITFVLVTVFIAIIELKNKFNSYVRIFMISKEKFTAKS